MRETQINYGADHAHRERLALITITARAEWMRSGARGRAPTRTDVIAEALDAYFGGFESPHKALLGRVRRKTRTGGPS